MNNRFKFRVWDKMRLQFIYPHNDNEQHFIIDLNGRFHNLQNGSGGDDYVIQQYTGLTDKNSKEIYEGDIVKYNNGDVIRIGYVGFMAGIFFLNYPDETDDELGYLLVSNLKVIGNIFEHSELLK